MKQSKREIIKDMLEFIISEVFFSLPLAVYMYFGITYLSQLINDTKKYVPNLIVIMLVAIFCIYFVYASYLTKLIKNRILYILSIFLLQGIIVAEIVILDSYLHLLHIVANVTTGYLHSC